MKTSSDKITVLDAAPFACRGGIKAFCLAAGLTYSVFLKEGYSAEALRATGDVLAERLVNNVLRSRGGQANG